jgi:hypothetical protein
LEIVSVGERIQGSVDELGRRKRRGNWEAEADVARLVG